MSSSDESEDENLKNIIAAADPSFFTNDLYNKSPDSTKLQEESRDVKKEEQLPKSQRYLDVEEFFETDLKVPRAMQEHIAKRLSSIIASQIEFVQPKIDDERHHVLERKFKKKWKSGVKLLGDSDVVIKYLEEHWDPDKVPKEKPLIKRRVVEPEISNEEEKVKQSVIEPDAILSGEELKFWAKRKENKVFKYKKSKGGDTLHFVEPENEFTKLRKKNCWSEKYIAKNKKR